MGPQRSAWRCTWGSGLTSNVEDTCCVHIWRCRPFQMHFQFSLRLPKLELPECPRTKKTQTRGGTCVSVLGPPVPEQAVWVSIARERGNPWAKRCVGPCWQRQPGKRSVCRSGLVPAAPTDPSRSTEDGVLAGSPLGRLF